MPVRQRTRDEVANDLLLITHELPDRTNPTTDYGNCVYQDADGRRCLTGEMLFRHHGAAPGYGSTYQTATFGELARAVATDLGSWPIRIRLGYTLPAIGFVTRAQALADNRRPWGTLRPQLLELLHDRPMYIPGVAELAAADRQVYA